MQIDPENPPPQRRRLRALLGRPAVLRRLRDLERGAAAPIVYGNRVEIFHSGRAAFDALLCAIDAARLSVAVEMYTWADDRLGRRVAEAVARAARRGVASFVLLDAFGSLGSGRLARSLQEAGVEVRWYHPLAPWTPSWSPNRRDHRKVVVVDGSVAFAGGLNLAEEYSEEFRGEGAWRDLAIRFEGPACREAARLFIGTWSRAGGRFEAAAAIVVSPAELGRAGIQVVGARRFRDRRSLRRALLVLLAGARRRVFVANAYFAPEPVLRRELVRIARRGIDVRLLLPSMSDVPLVRWAGRASFGPLLEAGVRIREHTGSVLHAKAAVVDEAVLMTGSANLDYRSFRHNLEVTVNVFDAVPVRAALDGFAADWERARPVSIEDWRRRPWSERLAERFATALVYWL